jgi:hypothetical protein
MKASASLPPGHSRLHYSLAIVSTASGGLHCVSGDQERGHKYTCLHACTHQAPVRLPTGTPTARRGKVRFTAPRRPPMHHAPLTRGRWQAALPEGSGHDVGAHCRHIGAGLSSPCAWRRRQLARAGDCSRRASRSLSAFGACTSSLAASCFVHGAYAQVSSGGPVRGVWSALRPGPEARIDRCVQRDGL